MATTGRDTVRAAVLVLRWSKDTTDLRMLARDARISIATAYRNVHEGLDVIVAHALQLHDVPASPARFSS